MENPSYNEELSAMLELFGNKLMTKKDSETIVKLVLDILTKFKNVTEEERASLKEKTDELISQHNLILQSVDLSVYQTKSELVDLFETSKKEILNSVSVLIEDFKKTKPKNGKPGKNAKPEDVVPLVLEKIKLPEYEKFILEDKGEQIVELIHELPTDDDEYKIDASHIRNLPKQRNNYIGGMHYLAGDGITIEGNVISSTGGSGGGFSVLETSSTVNSSNKSFVFPLATAQPAMIVSDGIAFRATSELGTTNWTWNSGTLTATLHAANVAPPTDELFAIASSGGGGGGGGSGTVTSVSVATANGVSGSVANSTTTPEITLTVKQPGILRVVASTDAATVTPDADTTDLGALSSLSQTTTIANPTGTPLDGQILELRIKSSSARSLSFGSSYRSGNDITLPTSTNGGSKNDYLKFMYNSTDSKWDIIGKITGY